MVHCCVYRTRGTGVLRRRAAVRLRCDLQPTGTKSSDEEEDARGRTDTDGLSNLCTTFSEEPPRSEHHWHEAEVRSANQPAERAEREFSYVTLACHHPRRCPLAAAAMLCRAAVSRGVSVQRLGNNVTFYMNESAPAGSGHNKPVLLMLPWLGSRPQAVAKYCEIYFRTGFDVLVVESQVQEFLWPRWGLAHGKRLLELLQSERFVSRQLLVHAFSIGGYTFAQLLVHISQDTQKYQALTQRIKGQVYDSLVVGSLETMAGGLAKTVFPRWEILVKQMSLLYFGMFRRQTVDYFNASIETFRNTPITAPALFFFCENDLLSDAPAMEDVIDLWRKRGMDVTAKKWEDSTHAGHLKRHQEEYLTTLYMFLHSLCIVPLKAKM